MTFRRRPLQTAVVQLLEEVGFQVQGDGCRVGFSNPLPAARRKLDDGSESLDVLGLDEPRRGQSIEDLHDLFLRETRVRQDAERGQPRQARFLHPLGLRSNKHLGDGRLTKFPLGSRDARKHLLKHFAPGRRRDRR